LYRLTRKTTHNRHKDYDLVMLFVFIFIYTAFIGSSLRLGAFLYCGTRWLIHLVYEGPYFLLYIHHSVSRCSLCVLPIKVWWMLWQSFKFLPVVTDRYIIVDFSFWEQVGRFSKMLVCIWGLWEWNCLQWVRVSHFGFRGKECDFKGLFRFVVWVVVFCNRFIVGRRLGMFGLGWGLDRQRQTN
jgi:hypothetical protein